MKYSLVLEGGGAKGAYQIGVFKALMEAGYEFNVIVGTSIGAINAACLVQEDFDRVYNLWKTLSFSDIFDIDSKYVDDTLNSDISLDTIKYLSKKLGMVIKEKGIDTTKIRKIMQDNISEEKIRKSKIRFGLVTLCLSDMKPQELFIEDIPDGKLIDYIMASSNLPIFQRAKIDEKRYLDGGAYDACPVSMLEKEGYENIITIRVFKKTSRIRNYRDIIKRRNVNMYMIQPFDTLPSILNFDSKNLNELLELGYYDGIKFVKNLDGFRYYFDNIQYDKVLSRIQKIDVNKKFEISKEAKVLYSTGENINEVFIEKTIKNISNITKIKELDNVKDMVVAIFEYVAGLEKIDRYRIYEFSDFVKVVKEKALQNENIFKKHRLLYEFVMYF